MLYAKKRRFIYAKKQQNGNIFRFLLMYKLYKYEKVKNLNFNRFLVKKDICIDGSKKKNVLYYFYMPHKLIN